MYDFSNLISKVDALKAKIEQSSITPLYLGSLLNDFLLAMHGIDMTDMPASVSAALEKATHALEQASAAMTDAQAAQTTAQAAQTTAQAAQTAAQAAQTAAESADGKADAAITETDLNYRLISQLQGNLQTVDWVLKSISAGTPDPAAVKTKMRRVNAWTYEEDKREIVLFPAATEEAAGAMTAEHVKSLKLVKRFMATKGHAEGIAPLGADKHVPDENIAPKFFDVLMFDSVVDEEVTVKNISATSLGYGDEGAAVVYSNKLCRFLLRITQAGVQKRTYYNKFRDYERYGTLGLDGVCPVEGKIYIEAERGYPYVWYDLMLFHIDHYAEDLVNALESTKGRADGIAPLDANTMIPAEHIPATFRNVAHFAEMIDSKPGAVSPGTAPGTVGDDEVDVVFCEASKRFLFRYTPADGLGRLAYFCKIDGWKNFGESADENGVIPSAGKLYVNDKQGDALYWHGNALRPLRPAIKESDDIHTTIANPGTAGQSVQLNLTEAARKSLFCDLFNAAAGTAGYAKFTNGVWDCKLNGLTLSYDEAVLIYNVTISGFTTGAFRETEIRTNLYKRGQSYGWGNGAENMPQGVFTNCYLLEVARINKSDDGVTWASSWRYMFNQCYALHTVIGVLGDTDSNREILIGNAPKLVKLRINRLARNLDIRYSPLWSLESVSYTIENAGNDTTAITITVHADVYAKLTGDTTNEAAAALTADELSQWQALLTKAAAKHIAFASA